MNTYVSQVYPDDLKRVKKLDGLNLSQGDMIILDGKKYHIARMIFDVDSNKIIALLGIY